MKKIALLIMMIVIIKLSATSGLRVSEPATWLNETTYQTNVSLTFLVDTDSDFFKPYKNMTSLNFILHKLSHILFYSILAILFYINVNKRLWIALPCLFLFALSDEIHQYYVVGRSGRALDVCLDFTAGTLTLLTVLYISKKIKINRDKSS